MRSASEPIAYDFRYQCMNRVRRPSQFTPMHRRRFLNPALGILAGATAALLSVQVALADTAAVNVTPSSGVATASISVDGSYVFTQGCPVGAAPFTVVFNFYWDNPNGPIWSTKTNTCVNKTTYLSGKSPAWVPPAAVATLGPHKILVDAFDGATGRLLGSNSTVYTITSPPSPIPTPPTATPSTQPPPVTTPPTQPPTSAPTPIQRPTPTAGPSPRCYVEGTSPACPSPSTPTCAPPVTALLPGTPGGGVPPLMLGLMVAPFGLMLVITPRLRSKRLTKVSALLLLVIAASCTWPPPKSVATSPVTAAVGFEVTPDCRGYWIAASDGGIFPFGGAIGYGSAGAIHLNKPIVDMESTPDGGGYWLVASDGGVFPFGNATGYGSTGAIKLNKPIVAIENTPDGGGYWLVAGDGGVFPFGNAVGYGSTGAIKLNKPIVDMEATPDGHGYWLVASDGGVFPFGNAVGYGSTGAIKLNKPIVRMDATPDGGGYWLVASDGGVFPFGNAVGYGSTGALKLKSPIVGMEATPDGHGYWLFAADGGVFPFGDASGLGSASGMI
ncbi:MAG TPA: hypothetical protein VK256_02540 [Candidatus Eisenbacteria bacterium]|nr:hypothetical protein [Candidatus Eisenbacteria bacterium]